MKDQSKIKDWRSTGRRIARRTLYTNRVPYECEGYKKPTGEIETCGKSTIHPPKDAHRYFNEIWPVGNRVLSSQLEADHKDKDYTNNSLDNLAWRCSSHHKLADRQTAKGVAQESVNYW